MNCPCVHDTLSVTFGALPALVRRPYTLFLTGQPKLRLLSRLGRPSAWRGFPAPHFIYQLNAVRSGGSFLPPDPGRWVEMLRVERFPNESHARRQRLVDGG